MSPNDVTSWLTQMCLSFFAQSKNLSRLFQTQQKQSGMLSSLQSVFLTCRIKSDRYEYEVE